MMRPALFILLCGVLALAAASAAPAQEVERPPQELWDQFPLEASPTPAQATPQATPRPRVVQAPESDGMTTPALIALLVAAASLGALAARTATRRMRPREPSGRPAIRTALAGIVRRRQQRDEASPPPAIEHTDEPPPRVVRPERTQATPMPPPETSKPPHPTSTLSRETSKRPREASQRPREAPKPPRATSKPPRATPEPTPPPAVPPASLVAPASPAFDTCRIRLHNRSIKAHFFAVPYDGGPVLARSPYFKIRNAEGDPGLSAPEALRALVDELTAAGWRQTSTGRSPWDLRFERATSAREAAAPRRGR